MEAMREDETAAQVMGVNVPRYRMGALVASAVLAGLAGCLSAHVVDFIGPNEFGFEPAVTILSFALLGGIGTPLGPVLGAVVLTLLPELLRDVPDMRPVLNGVIIVLAVLFLPGGLLPLRMQPGMSLLALHGLTRRYAGLVAVDGVDLEVEAGGIHAVIGPNGAGKTTLFNLVAGLVAASGRRDRARRAGRDPACPRPPRGAGPGPHVPEHPRVRRHDGAGERADRPAPAARRACSARCCAPAGFRREERAASTGRAALLRPGRPGGAGRPPARAACPTATSAGWRSPAPWPRPRGCCCSTSRPRA